MIVNASPAGADPQQLADLASAADVVVVNDTEVDEWQWPVPYLVVTRGGAGVTLIAGETAVDVPATAVEPIDTTGAGDVFAGVLAASWCAMAPQSAVRRAAAAGALATLIPGAGDCAPTAEMIEDALSR